MYQLLYVDDEPGLLELGKEFLERDGTFAVDTMLSAVDALRRMVSSRYDAVISDYQMPEIDGIEFLKRIRSLGMKTPFIIFTGKGREEVVIEAINSGADFYLQKGGDPRSQFAELIHKIRQAIQIRQADLALQKSVRDYRHLIDSASEGIAVIQGEIIRMVNPWLIELTGYPEEELIGHPIAKTVHPEDLARMREHFRNGHGGGNKSARQTIRILRRDKGTDWVEFHFVPIVWDERPATLVFVTKITERKAAEDALRKSEREYRNILEKMQDAYIRADTDGRVTMVNPSAVRMYGYGSAGEMLGLPAVSFYARPEDRVALLKIMESSGGVTDIAGQNMRKDGTIFYGSTNVQFIRDDDGRIRGTEGLVRDMSERVATERKLKESEELYHSIFQTAMDGIFITSPDGRYIDFNESVLRILGAGNRADVFASRVADVYTRPGDRETLLGMVHRDGYVRNHPVRLRRLDGSSFDAVLTVTVQKTPEGAVSAYVGTIRELS